MGKFNPNVNKQNKKHAALYSNSIWLFNYNTISSNHYDGILNSNSDALNKRIARMAPRRHKKDKERLQRTLHELLEKDTISMELIDFLQELDDE